MNFLITTIHGTRIVEAEDWDRALEEAYDDHTGYRDVISITKIEEVQTWQR